MNKAQQAKRARRARRSKKPSTVAVRAGAAIFGAQMKHDHKYWFALNNPDKPLSGDGSFRGDR